MGSSDKSMDSGFLEPIAIVGYSMGFPQDAVNSEALWDILMKKRNTATEFPPDRLNANSVYHPDANRRGQVSILSIHKNARRLTHSDSCQTRTLSQGRSRCIRCIVFLDINH
jgi:hypothetical protein